jgi:hypothetical protein
MKKLVGFASVLVFFVATGGRAAEVDVAIVCPEKVTANINWNDKIGSDPTFHFESGTETLTFDFGHMQQQGQSITCSYKRWALIYEYKVKRTIKSCAQVSPRILECKVVQ